MASLHRATGISSIGSAPITRSGRLPCDLPTAPTRPRAPVPVGGRLLMRGGAPSPTRTHRGVCARAADKDLLQLREGLDKFVKVGRSHFGGRRLPPRPP